MRALHIAAALCIAGPCAVAQGGLSPLEIDHVMIHVAPGAPERTALEQAGFRIAKAAAQHEGQGSASVFVELANGFLELTWRDESVRVSPGLEIVAQRFARQSAWRTSGWSPVGIGMRRGLNEPDSLPFPTRSVRADWMEPGATLELLNAVNDSAGPRLWVVPRVMAANSDRDHDSERTRTARSEDFAHPNGARRITAVKIVAPAAALTSPMTVVQKLGVIEFERGSEWLVEVTLDGAAKHEVRDLRPRLPLLIRW